MDIIGSKGGDSAHTPVETPDNIQSTDNFKILDLVSEGEIAGLVNGTQSVFFDETPMTDTDAVDNFPGASVQIRTGTQDQTYIKGFDSIGNTVADRVELTHGVPWVKAFNDLTLSAVRVTIALPRLESSQSNGDVGGTSVSYTIALSTDGGAYSTIFNGSVIGKTTTEAHRAHRIDLPDATQGWSIKVTRNTADSDSQTLINKTFINSYTMIVDGKFRHPNSALIAVTGDAKQFSNIPRRSYDLWGRIISVPSNYDAKTRTYSGTWDGTFKPSWTDNPAWVFYDLITHPRYGLGHLVDASLVDKWVLYKIGQYCDQMVSDG